MAQEAELTEPSKYISTYYHFVRERVDRGEIKLTYVPPGYNVSDILTKELGGEKHVKLAARIGIGYCGDVETF